MIGASGALLAPQRQVLLGRPRRARVASRAPRPSGGHVSVSGRGHYHCQRPNSIQLLQLTVLLLSHWRRHWRHCTGDEYIEKFTVTDD